jgi:uncharacterized protein with FMN-binding domain
MTPPRQYGDPRTGRGRTIAVATIATVSGVTALFAYHTSPGHTVALIEQAMSGSAMPASAATTTTPAPRAAAPTGGAAPMGRGGRAAAGTAAPVAPTAPAAAGGSGGAATAGGTTANATGTFTGAPANTRWGIVQVKITVQGGKVVKATTVQSPHGSAHSIDINTNAVPILNQEAVQAGSSKIDAVSGATVTSGGYTQSLQSALDAARL